MYDNGKPPYNLSVMLVFNLDRHKDVLNFLLAMKLVSEVNIKAGSSRVFPDKTMSD